MTAIASPFPYSKGAVIADIFAGCEVYVCIYGTCVRKPKGGLLYRVRPEVKRLKKGEVELVVPPLFATESFVINEIMVETGTGRMNFGNSVSVDVSVRGLNVHTTDTLYIKPIEITIT